MNFKMSTEGFIEDFVKQLLISGFQHCVGQTFEVTSHLFSRYLTASVEINGPFANGPNGTSCIDEFIKRKCDEKSNHFQITSGLPRLPIQHYDRLLGIENNIEEAEETSCDFKDQLKPIPNNWSFFFWYKGTCIRVIRSIQVSNPQLGSGNMETLKIIAYFTRNKDVYLMRQE